MRLQFSRIMDLLGATPSAESFRGINAEACRLKLLFKYRDSVYADTVEGHLKEVGETKLTTVVLSPSIPDYREYFRGVKAFAWTFLLT